MIFLNKREQENNLVRLESFFSSKNHELDVNVMVTNAIPKIFNTYITISKTGTLILS
ncbi:hypothetical protein [Nonlabens sp.]|uniref:hypothetical protein n=1 Tax=Nonlabens sp. TaxID=1888209 RepID=UPI001BCE2305|nr:hypothetical protein [Nonlabens sp.]